MNACWVQAGIHPRSVQRKPSKMRLTRFGGALGAQRGPKCSEACVPLHNAAAVLLGRPSHTTWPKSLLRDTCISGATAKRIHLATRFTPAVPCNKKITGEQIVKILVEQWLEHYETPKGVHSDEDVHIRSVTGWYKRVLDTLNVHVTTGVPYTHTSNPLCERQNRVVEQNLRILMKQERTKDLVRLSCEVGMVGGGGGGVCTGSCFRTLLPPRFPPLPFPCLSLCAGSFFWGGGGCVWLGIFGAGRGCGCVLVPVLVWVWVS